MGGLGERSAAGWPVVTRHSLEFARDAQNALSCEPQSHPRFPPIIPPCRSQPHRRTDANAFAWWICDCTPEEVGDFLIFRACPCVGFKEAFCCFVV